MNMTVIEKESCFSDREFEFLSVIACASEYIFA
uniref:Uncharacterized protein n=1 Tax=Rhizophora mucronata TaxID=61149 RepID=A0A2P2QBF8_RHIMU